MQGSCYLLLSGRGQIKTENSRSCCCSWNTEGDAAIDELSESDTELGLLSCVGRPPAVDVHELPPTGDQQSASVRWVTQPQRTREPLQSVVVVVVVVVAGV